MVVNELVVMDVMVDFAEDEVKSVGVDTGSGCD